MCTVTWRREAEAYEVFFNRDEQRTRAAARPPAVLGTQNNPYLAALDGQAGGTWLAVTARGLTLGLLNFYDGQAAPPPPNPLSRGHLVLELIDLADARAVAQGLAVMDLARYPAFLLLALDPQRGFLMHWDGRTARAGELTGAHRPLSTSSFETDEVLRERRMTYERMIGSGEPSPGQLDRFHHERNPRGDAYSVWMARPDAWTVSFSRVRVDPDRVHFAYEARDSAHPVVVTGPRRA